MSLIRFVALVAERDNKIAPTRYCYLPLFLLLCPLIVESKPQHHNLYGDYYGNRAGQQSAMQFDGHNPYSSFSDEMALIQQYLPLNPFQKLLVDSQIGFQQDEDEENKNGRGFFTYTHTMTETRHRGDVRTIFCTTSTKALSTCSPSGRRKRFSKGVRGLFYNEEVQKTNFEEGEQMQIEDETNVLLHTFANKNNNKDLKTNQEHASSSENIDTISMGYLDRKMRESRGISIDSIPYLPYELQSGFRNIPEDYELSRVFLASTTVTTWKTGPRVYISTITATCRSTTNFRTCGGQIYGGWGNYGGWGDWD